MSRSASRVSLCCHFPSYQDHEVDGTGSANCALCNLQPGGAGVREGVLNMS